MSQNAGPDIERGGLCRLLLLDLEGLQHGCCGLLDALALSRSFDPGDGLFATSGPARDVPEGVVACVESECLANHVGRGLSLQFSECSVVKLLVEQCVADFVRQRLHALCGCVGDLNPYAVQLVSAVAVDAAAKLCILNRKADRGCKLDGAGEDSSRIVA